MTPPTLREWLAEGPFALAMSSGFFAFFAHTGVMGVLEDAGFLPHRVAGSSAGALVTAAWAAGVDAPVLARELVALERAHFWDPSLGLGVLRGRRFRERLDGLLPRARFAECRVPAAVSAFDALSGRTHVIDDGLIAPAIQASCAVPLLFQPVVIAGRAYLDGGIRDRPGLAGMPRGEPRILFHHIASKSPWRSALAMPRRPGMVTVVLDGLPRAGPFRLDEGRRALAVARRGFASALDVAPRDGVLAFAV